MMLAFVQDPEIENEEVDAANNVMKNAPHTQYMICGDDWNFPYSRSKLIPSICK